jgi:hypothetical protein
VGGGGFSTSTIYTMFLKSLLTALLFATLMLLACRQNNCPDGFKCIDDTCVCPDDKFIGKGMCRDLRPNEYYATLDHCACKDTIFFEIMERTHNNIVARLDLGWGYQQNSIAIINTPEGDSLYTEKNSAYVKRLACDFDGKLLNTQIFGRFIENDTKIRIHLKYMRYPDFEEEVGSCDFVLHQ